MPQTQYPDRQQSENQDAKPWEPLSRIRSRTQPASPLVCVTRNRPSKCPRGCLNNCRLPFIFVIGTVSFFDTIAAPLNYGAGRLKSAILMNVLRIVSNVPPGRQSAPAP
jgi:hypothetical protein